MSAIEDKIRIRTKELLESGEVAEVIGWGKGRFENQTSPLFIKDPSRVDELVYNDYCVNTLGKYAYQMKGDGKIALCVRGCDARAINRMLSDKALNREDVYLLGIPCEGMRDRKTNEVLKKCQECRHHNPVVYDELLGEEVEFPLPENRFVEVEAIEQMSTQERADYFDTVFSKCIRCYACRDVCPCCTCNQCFVDQREADWQGKQSNIPENRFFGLTRAFHVGDRCIECGECERVCPMGLPLMSLNRKLIKDMNTLFGEFEAGMGDEGPDVLRTYKLDDVEEFM